MYSFMTLFRSIYVVFYEYIEVVSKIFGLISKKHAKLPQHIKFYVETTYTTVYKIKSLNQKQKSQTL